MKCPYCRHDNDKVIDSRASEEGFVIRRRRLCVNCEKRFTTYERVAELELRVIKKDGAREVFKADKIRQGLERACWKRPISTDLLEETIHQLVQQVYMLNESEVSTQQIGELVMQQLVDLDDVAYIRFASVYRQFKDIHDFVAEVRPILDRNQLRVEDVGSTSAIEKSTSTQ